MARRLSILAGSGPLVDHLIAAACAAGDDVQVIAFSPRTVAEGVTVLPGDIAQPQQALQAIAMFRSTHVVLGGAISLGDRQREGLAQLAGGSGATQGDAALSGLVVTIEKLTGAKVLGAHEIAADLLAPTGLFAGPAIDTAAPHLKAALDAARTIGRLDLGQAVVLSGARVVAAEDVGGTDELLARVGRHRELGRLGDGSATLVLAKAAKPQQPLHVDMPAIGADTVREAARAGVRIIAVEAGKTLVLDRAGLVAAAEAAGVSVVGLTDG